MKLFMPHQQRAHSHSQLGDLFTDKTQHKSQPCKWVTHHLHGCLTDSKKCCIHIPPQWLYAFNLTQTRMVILMFIHAAHQPLHHGFNCDQPKEHSAPLPHYWFNHYQRTATSHNQKATFHSWSLQKTCENTKLPFVSDKIFLCHLNPIGFS